MRRSRAFFAGVVLLQLALLQLSLCGAEAKKAAPKKDLAARIAAVLAQPQLARADWGIDVVDLKTGKTIYARNADRLFLPASNAKLLTTSAAMAYLGPNYRFRTTVETTGQIDAAGRLDGDLVIVGRGDPNISGRELPYYLKSQSNPPHTQILEDMANQIAQSGLKTVTGDIIGDDTFYAPQRYPDGWAQDDLQWLDGAPISALTFNDNSIFLKVAPAAQPGDKALVTFEPQSNYYELDNRIITAPAGTARKVGIHRDPGSRKILLWGVLPQADTGFTEAISIEDPAEFTAEIFRSLLEARGITIAGKARARHGDLAQFFDQIPPQDAAPVPSPAPDVSACCGTHASSPASPDGSATPPVPQPPQSTILALHMSLPLIEDIRVINKTSQNLHAELALRLIGAQSEDNNSYEGGIAALQKFLHGAGVTDEEYSFTDGSGLSRRDLITPAAMVRVLLHDAKQTWGPALEESLPVAGVDGSLTDRFLNTQAMGRVHAKTGTLSHVSALSGYGQTLSGRRFAFSIFCNKINLPSSKAAAAIDQIVRLLVGAGR
ncbi:MAG TPA: D-alanyl-D-alanine carboxypeptidase/D-alanyl-D-alanine-endopeptidase [Verrucomicrobiae bacterium]|jgi:D-alanyl-D-alanine carboxypeptidase/D-alanyl-D-alanine-endopeptidase (penicillin-binding protein 4)|nr:D-alanyl-D-alanine carboxypeptidase/D-alanyl-D-alanine-endopeptidase [Verrucomicrobiae bacterium]